MDAKVADRSPILRSVQRPKNAKYIFKSRWKRLGARVFDALGHVVFVGRSHKPWDLSEVRNILVIRMDQLGDVVFAAPVLEYLHEVLPGASIDFLTGPWAAPLVKTFPYVHDTLVFDANWYSPDGNLADRVANTRKVIRILRGNRYDLGIDLRGDLRNIALMRAGRITHTIGYGITGGKFLLDRSVPYDFSAHQVDLNLRLIAEVAGGVRGEECVAPTKEQRKPRLFCPDGVKEAVFDHAWLSNSRPRILLHAEAGYPSKRWSKKRFVQLIASLCERGANIGLIGLEQDDMCDAPQLIKHSDRIVDLRGKTNLLELCALISESDLLIGNDSAPAHLAASLGTSCVVLFSGANDPSKWRPLGEHVHLVFHPVRCSPCESLTCLMSTHECMDAISVYEVEGVVHEILSAKGLLPRA